MNDQTNYREAQTYARLSFLGVLILPVGVVFGILALTKSSRIKNSKGIKLTAWAGILISLIIGISMMLFFYALSFV